MHDKTGVPRSAVDVPPAGSRDEGVVPSLRREFAEKAAEEPKKERKDCVMYMQPYLLDRLHSVREHDMLEAARRARLRKALVHASGTEPRPSVWMRARLQLARLAPHSRVPRQRTVAV